jgi:hypothetical protein
MSRWASIAGQARNRPPKELCEQMLVAFVVTGLVITFVVVAACMMSSQCSRKE